MIRTIKIDVNAANPQLPLQPTSVFEGSAASLVLLNVPRSLGERKITAVSVVVINPDSMAQAYEAKREGSAYQVTIPAEAFGGSGSVENGIMISASGVNERGETVDQWILGSGDLRVMQHNGTVKPGERRFAVHIYDAPPLHPVRGDMAPINGLYMLYNGIEWIGLGSGKGGSGAIVLRMDGGKVYNGEDEVATFADLRALVRAGGVSLLGTVGAQKDALFYPLYCDETAIRFDATGTLGNDVKTKSYTMQRHPVSGKILISEGALVELVKKTDFDALSSRKLDIENASRDLIFATFKEGQQDNQAIVSEFTIPLNGLNVESKITKFKIRAASSDAGEWDRRVLAEISTIEGSRSILSGTFTTLIIGQWNEFLVLNESLDLRNASGVRVRFYKDTGLREPAKVRIALVSVDSSAGYSVKLSNGSTVYNFAPMFELIGAIPRDQAIDMLTLRRAEIGRIAALASNASQSQIIAKINELVNLLK